MTTTDSELLQQLCAWMDGELPDEQARFLQRRLDNDPALRAQWERWQLASACLRGQAVRQMPASLSQDIAKAIAGDAPRPARAMRWPWLAGAAAAVFAMALLPRMLAPDAAPGLSLASGAGSSPDLSLASSVQAPAAPIRVPVAATPAPASPVAALPSVRDFPLVEAGRSKAWPRSPLAPDARSMDAYLVRHNTLMAEDGLGGFMPYVDVVTQESQAPAPEGDADP